MVQFYPRESLFYKLGLQYWKMVLYVPIAFFLAKWLNFRRRLFISIYSYIKICLYILAPSHSPDSLFEQIEIYTSYTRLIFSGLMILKILRLSTDYSLYFYSKIWTPFCSTLPLGIIINWTDLKLSTEGGFHACLNFSYTIVFVKKIVLSPYDFSIIVKKYTLVKICGLLFQQTLFPFTHRCFVQFLFNIFPLILKKLFNVLKV